MVSKLAGRRIVFASILLMAPRVFANLRSDG